ncbi:MAG: FISUMP domain-containing protein [Bacteroidota bacterium]
MKKNLMLFVLLALSLVFIQCNPTQKEKSNKLPKIKMGKFTDTRDGRIYSAVKIENQTWMAENLNFSSDSSWYYNNDSLNYSKYGRLYTFDAAKIACPKGWHLPFESDWNLLISNLGGKNLAGGKLKTKTDWKAPNIGASNFSKFSALPSGYYDVSLNEFFLEKINANFWIDNKSAKPPKYISIYFDASEVIITKPYKNYGLCIRCVKD